MHRPSPLNRRAFLQQAALLAGAVGFPSFVPSSVLGADGTVPPSRRITLGAIGVGGQGTADMRGLLSSPEVRVLAVCDPFEERRRKAKELVDAQYKDSGCAMYGDFREVIARQDIDALLIAPQDHWHALIATAGAKAGKHMYCEKPLGVSYAESRAIRDAVRQSGVVFQTGTQQRSERNFRHACELARNNYLGKIHTVQVAAPGPNYRPSYKGSRDPQPVPPGFDWEMWLGPAPQKPYNPGRHAWPDWYLIWDYCYGFIVNWGVHHLDIALWGMPALAQETFEVQAHATYRNEGFTDNVDGWHAIFTYPSGLKMVYSDSVQQQIGIRFIGDKGWVHVDRGGIWADPESLLELKLSDSDLHLHVSQHHGRDFLQSVRSGKDPVADVDAGHKATYFGMVADIAARLQRTVRWDPKQEAFIGDAEANAQLTRPMRAPWKL